MHPEVVHQRRLVVVEEEASSSFGCLVVLPSLGRLDPSVVHEVVLLEVREIADREDRPFLVAADREDLLVDHRGP